MPLRPAPILSLEFLKWALTLILCGATAGGTVAQQSTSRYLRPAKAKDGNWGFVDRTGRFRIAPTFAGAFEFSDNVAVVWTFDGYTKKLGIVSPQGKYTTLPPYDYDLSFYDGFARIQALANGNWVYGYIDRSGAQVIKPRFVYAGDFAEGLAWAAIEKDRQYLYGFIDKHGKFVIPPTYSSQPGNFRDGLARVTGEFGIGFIDRSGRYVIPPTNDNAGAGFSEGLVAVIPPGDAARGLLLDRAGHTLLDIPFWNQRTRRQLDLHRNGWEVVTQFSEGLAPVQVLNRIGFIDKAGKLVIQAYFREVHPFSEGLAAVKVISSDGEYVWGYIAHDGEFVIQPQYKTAFDFRGGLAEILDAKGNRLLIDQAGRKIASR